MNTSNDLQKQYSPLQNSTSTEWKSCMNKTEVCTQSEVSNVRRSPRLYHRRSFLRSVGIGAVALAPGAALLSGARKASAQSSSANLTQGDADILRFLAAAEILESDL